MAAALLIAVLLAAVVAYVSRYALIRARLDLPPFTHEPGTVEAAPLTARDGVRLATHVHEPDGDGPWPTVLMRDPYGTADLVCEFVVRYGYACVHQDVRGRFESEGEFYPFVHERDDGIDTLRWLAEQEFHDGNIALIGVSYLGIVQFAVADRLPPEVKTLVPVMAHGDIYALAYEGGLFQHAVASAWSAAHADRPDAAMWRAFRARPAPDSLRDLGVELPWFDDWIAHQARDDYWESERYRKLRTSHREVDVPVLLVAGWYDFFLEGQLRVFDELPTRERSRLLVVPGGHVGQLGDLQMPGEHGVPLLAAEVLAWLDHHLRGAPLDGPDHGVSTYVIGEGSTVHRETWPPPTEPRVFHLDAAPAARTCEGGRLEDHPVLGSQSVSFTYDPSDPVPSRGGAKSIWSDLGGPALQDDACKRDDVLTFLSSPLAAPLHLAGSPEVHLVVASHRPDSSFVVRLVEVRDDGAAYSVRERATALAFRDGSGVRREYRPGEAVPLILRMAPIERVFPAGARIRLDVTSSSFPQFHVHSNHAGPWRDVPEAIPAEQTLYLTQESAAHLVLPVLDE
jgi:putative CocE/NonD family hydrolase